MGGQKDSQQEKSKSREEVFSMIEGIYSRSRYMGRKGELSKHKGSIKRF